MRRRLALALALVAGLFLAAPVLADPPDHAPAHGWRGKHKHHPKHKHQRHHHHREHHDHGDHHAHRDSRDRGPMPAPGGFEVVFDPERGISVAVGFPDVYFHRDHFYRHHRGAWQRSARADGGWSPIAPNLTPPEVLRALPHPPMPPVPAKLDPTGKKPRLKGRPH